MTLSNVHYQSDNDVFHFFYTYSFVHVVRKILLVSDGRTYARAGKGE